MSIVGLLVLSGCSAPPPESAPSPRAVEVVEVTSSIYQSSHVYSGTLRAKQRSNLSFLRTGQIIELTKDLGQTFKRGDILARLNDIELSLALDQLSASLLEIRAELNDAQIGYDRLIALDGTGAVSRADIDTAIARLDAAKARVSANEASIGQARKRLSEMVLKAPYDGQIVERLLEPSQTASAGQTVYRIIGNDGGYEAIVNLPVSSLDLFVEGYETNINVRPSGTVKAATVIEVGNAAGLSGLYPISLKIEDPTGLRPGLRVEVPGLDQRSNGQSISIPLTAYRPNLGSKGTVFIVDLETGSLSQRNVELGAISDTGIEIRSGLQIGDVIVARGLPSLRETETVAPIGIGLKRFNE